MRDGLIEQLKNVPHKPGVYLFKDQTGSVIYVGKAKDLRNRLGQYFQKGGDGRPQIPFLMESADSFEQIVTDNEVESLFLENNLIKKYKPHYNIKLRDDKNYAFIKIDYNEEIPQIYVIRNPDSKNARYFGPYSSTIKIRETLNIIRKIFPFCSNKKVSARPCFYYYLHRCPGVCIGKVTPEEYKRDTLKKINSFLAGNISEIKNELKKQMKSAAQRKNFEEAAAQRDKLRTLAIIEERQNAVFAKKVNWDFISYIQTADKSTVNVFVIRNGKLLDRKNFILEDTSEKTGAQQIEAFIEKYYLESSDFPKEIFVQEIPENLEILAKLFEKTKTKITKPSRGKKLSLIKLGIKNAKEYFENWSVQQASELSKTTLALEELAKVLKIQDTLTRIECFDISNTQGTNSVASMVVFENGKPKKSAYRKFKMRQQDGPNDFAMMREALTRRFRPAHTETGFDKNDKWELPNLLVIDGGKGQLGITAEVLREYGLTIPCIGLAKRDEEIFVPGKKEPILLPKSDYALQLLQRIRDEAHRFAITFHKQLRSKKAYKSVLDEIKGIGPKKKKLLIHKFGSVSGIKKADHKELVGLVGDLLARELKERL